MNDTKTLKLTSPIPCSVNHYLKPRAYIVHGKPQVTMYETAEAKIYKRQFIQYVQDEAKKQKFVMSQNKSQHYYVDCVFYFDRVDKDCNNYWKLLLDAITESQCVWIDDNVCCERVNAIYYDKAYPRIEIEIKAVPYRGIFPDIVSLKHFSDQCMTCKKFRNGRCSIYTKALEGRIQEEITDFTCLKIKE